MLKIEDYFVVEIRHTIINQNELDKALNRLNSLGVVPTFIRSIEDYLDWMKEEEEDGLHIDCVNIVGNTSFLSPNSSSDEECIKLTDNILNIFGANSKVNLRALTIMQTPPNYIEDVYLKWLPNCECGLVVYNQSGVSFETVKSILNNNGFYNIVLNKKCNSWMKIDFDADSIWLKNCRERYFKGCGISNFTLYTDRHNVSYEYLQEHKFKIISRKKSNSFDFSGDDMSSDPRLW